MRQKRLLILPITGLLLFALGTYASIRFNRESHAGSHKYFYWSSIRLESNPLDRRFRLVPCNSSQPDCPPWEPEHIWVEPGVLAKFYVISAFPAFLLGLFLTRSLGRLGVNEITTFMLSMPVLIFAWYYLVSWIVARLIKLRRKHTLTAENIG
jgi:hypothetical protein